MLTYCHLCFSASNSNTSKSSPALTLAASRIQDVSSSWPDCTSIASIAVSLGKPTLSWRPTWGNHTLLALYLMVSTTSHLSISVEERAVSRINSGPISIALKGTTAQPFSRNTRLWPLTSMVEERQSLRVRSKKDHSKKPKITLWKNARQLTVWAPWKSPVNILPLTSLSRASLSESRTTFRVSIFLWTIKYLNIKSLGVQFGIRLTTVHFHFSSKSCRYLLPIFSPKKQRIISISQEHLRRVTF